jgi:hypothetical protein
VDSERHAPTCHRYIELNPVRAAMTATFEAYRWSSYHHNALGNDDPRLTRQREYLALGTHIEQRRRAYRDLLENAISDERLADIRAYLQQERVLGIPRSPGTYQIHARSTRHTPTSRQAKGISLIPFSEPLFLGRRRCPNAGRPLCDVGWTEDYRKLAAGDGEWCEQPRQCACRCMCRSARAPNARLLLTDNARRSVIHLGRRKPLSC